MHQILLALLTAAVLCSTDVYALDNDINSIAVEFAPPYTKEFLKAVEITEWDFGASAIAAFYKRPLIYAEKTQNYGVETNVDEIIGILFVPLSDGTYKRVEIDSYGPEGSTAEIDFVYSLATKKKSDPALFVEVSWHPNPGEIKRTCAYLKPLRSPLPKKLVRARGYKCL